MKLNLFWTSPLKSAPPDLVKAMDKRSLEDLEKAINFVKKHGFEAYMPEEMIKANKMLLSLKRLKRLRDEILNLKQSTVAEIRSYSKPPDQVHKVMIATYLLLGNKEKELQVSKIICFIFMTTIVLYLKVSQSGRETVLHVEAAILCMLHDPHMLPVCSSVMIDECPVRTRLVN